jgi:hypothetical protein
MFTYGQSKSTCAVCGRAAVVGATGEGKSAPSTERKSPGQPRNHTYIHHQRTQDRARKIRTFSIHPTYSPFRSIPFHAFHPIPKATHAHLSPSYPPPRNYADRLSKHHLAPKKEKSATSSRIHPKTCHVAAVLCCNAMDILKERKVGATELCVRGSPMCC